MRKKLWQTHRACSPSWCHCHFCRHLISRAAIEKEEGNVSSSEMERAERGRFAHSQEDVKWSYKTYTLFTLFCLNICKWKKLRELESWVEPSPSHNTRAFRHLTIYFTSFCTLKIDLNSKWKSLQLAGWCSTLSSVPAFYFMHEAVYRESHQTLPSHFHFYSQPSHLVAD